MDQASRIYNLAGINPLVVGWWMFQETWKGLRDLQLEDTGVCGSTSSCA